MPWHWTDDLARTLIDAGKAEPSQMVKWLSAPVAVRSPETDSQSVACSLLEEEEGEPPPSLLAA